MALNILLADDHEVVRLGVRALIERQPGMKVVGEAATVQEAIDQAETLAPDVVVLDIRMPGISGLDLARLVGRFAHPPVVVFVTAYEQHAVEAFDMAATDFLRKPIRAERLGEAVRRVAAKRDTGRASGVDQNDETIAVELAGRTSYIRRSTIVLVEATGDYVRLHTAAGSHLVRTPLSTLEERWTEAGFLRVHRRFLVNRHQVQGLRTSAGKIEIELNGGRVVPVSRRHTAAVRAALVGGHRIDREP